MLARIFPDRFILLLLLTLLVASLFPVEGAALRIVTLSSNAMIFGLFFFHGVRLAHRDVVDGVRQWRLQAAVLGVGYILVPLVALAMAAAMPGLLPPLLWTGILFLAVLPTTVQSAIAYASMAGGNVAASVIASSGSNLLAVVATPVLFALVGNSGGADISFSGETIIRIILLLLAPFALGQASQRWISGWAARRKAWIGKMDKAVILIAVYVAFSAAAAQGLWARLDTGTLLTLIGVVILLQAAAFLIAGGVGRVLNFDRGDWITLLFCGAHKSLATGAPIAGIMFAPVEAGFILVPLILYHQFQLTVSAWIAAGLASKTYPA
jgi:solute carrier family 10 (sodium/bile acid cotransporter), member 7